MLLILPVSFCFFLILKCKELRTMLLILSVSLGNVFLFVSVCDSLGASDSASLVWVLFMSDSLGACDSGCWSVFRFYSCLILLASFGFWSVFLFLNMSDSLEASDSASLVWMLVGVSASNHG